MIRIENLRKRYGKFEALKGIDLEIKKGSAFGFVGPNGAGKSTTMMILATLLAPSGGRAWVGGFEVTEKPKAVRRLIGYMPDFFGVYDNLKAGEYLDFYGAAYGLDPVRRSQTIPQLLELVNLAHKADAYVDTLSRGMKQRLGLARCLIHDPEVLILDEPASGLDPRARIEMREILKELRSMGKTILISSHILPELAELCDHLAVIENGRLVAGGPVEAIAAQAKGCRLLDIRFWSGREEGARWLARQPQVAGVELEQERLLVTFNGDEEAQAGLLRGLLEAGFAVTHFGEASTNLEDVFLKVTEGVVG